jgi:hypothetical protein
MMKDAIRELNRRKSLAETEEDTEKHNAMIAKLETRLAKKEEEKKKEEGIAINLIFVLTLV